MQLTKKLSMKLHNKHTPEVTVHLQRNELYPGEQLRGIVQLSVTTPTQISSLDLRLNGVERAYIGGLFGAKRNPETRYTTYYRQYIMMLGNPRNEALKEVDVTEEDSDHSIDAAMTRLNTRQGSKVMQLLDNATSTSLLGMANSGLMANTFTSSNVAMNATWQGKSSNNKSKKSKNGIFSSFEQNNINSDRHLNCSGNLVNANNFNNNNNNANNTNITASNEYDRRHNSKLENNTNNNALVSKPNAENLPIEPSYNLVSNANNSLTSITSSDVFRTRQSSCSIKSGSIPLMPAPNLLPGTYSYPFIVTLPKTIPPSSYYVEKTNAAAKLVYSIKATLILKSGVKTETVKEFIVLPLPLPLQRWLRLHQPRKSSTCANDGITTQQDENDKKARKKKKRENAKRKEMELKKLKQQQERQSDLLVCTASLLSSYSLLSSSSPSPALQQTLNKNNLIQNGSEAWCNNLPNFTQLNNNSNNNNNNNNNTCNNDGNSNSNSSIHSFEDNEDDSTFVEGSRIVAQRHHLHHYRNYTLEKIFKDEAQINAYRTQQLQTAKHNNINYNYYHNTNNKVNNNNIRNSNKEHNNTNVKRITSTTTTSNAATTAMDNLFKHAAMINLHNNADDASYSNCSRVTDGNNNDKNNNSMNNANDNSNSDCYSRQLSFSVDNDNFDSDIIAEGNYIAENSNELNVNGFDEYDSKNKMQETSSEKQQLQEEEISHRHMHRNSVETKSYTNEVDMMYSPDCNALDSHSTELRIEQKGVNKNNAEEHANDSKQQHNRHHRHHNHHHRHRKDRKGKEDVNDSNNNSNYDSSATTTNNNNNNSITNNNVYGELDHNNTVVNDNNTHFGGVESSHTNNMTVMSMEKGKEEKKEITIPQEWTQEFSLPIKGILFRNGVVKIHLVMNKRVLVRGKDSLRVDAMVDNTGGPVRISKVKAALITRLRVKSKMEELFLSEKLTEVEMNVNIDKGQNMQLPTVELNVPANTICTLCTNGCGRCTFVHFNIVLDGKLNAFMKAVESEVLIVDAINTQNTSTRLLYWRNYYINAHLAERATSAPTIDLRSINLSPIVISEDEEDDVNAFITGNNNNNNNSSSKVNSELLHLVPFGNLNALQRIGKKVNYKHATFLPFTDTLTVNLNGINKHKDKYSGNNNNNIVSLSNSNLENNTNLLSTLNPLAGRVNGNSAILSNSVDVSNNKGNNNDAVVPVYAELEEKSSNNISNMNEHLHN